MGMKQDIAPIRGLAPEIEDERSKKVFGRQAVDVIRNTTVKEILEFNR
jgi:hypothetical protein